MENIGARVFPYHDDNDVLRTPYVTLAIIAACAFVWLFVQGGGMEPKVSASVCNLGLIPGELTARVPPGASFPMGRNLVCVTEGGRNFSHILYSMFLHGSWMHLLGNMWFFWLFGNNIEDSMTRPRFLVFYLMCGLAAALMQVISQPGSVIPMVGASGAISGVMGAYLLLFPKVKVHTFFPPFFTFALPAWVMLGYWMLAQLVGGLSQNGSEGGVAFWAHVGGFLAGLLTVKLFVRHDNWHAHNATDWRPQRRFYSRNWE